MPDFGAFLKDPKTGEAYRAGADASGNVMGSTANPTVTREQQSSYTLATNITLAAGATSTPVPNVRGGSYIYGLQMSGTGNSLVLEALGPDGVNYQTVSTDAASGAKGVVAGETSTLRLRNAGAGAVTGIYAKLS